MPAAGDSDVIDSKTINSEKKSNITCKKEKGIAFLNLSVVKLLLICLGTFRKSLQRAITKTKGISGNDYPGTPLLWSAA
jgi:hypothetical protein